MGLVSGDISVSACLVSVLSCVHLGLLTKFTEEKKVVSPNPLRVPKRGSQMCRILLSTHSLSLGSFQKVSHNDKNSILVPYLFTKCIFQFQRVF